MPPFSIGDSRGAQTPVESRQTWLTSDNKLSSSDGQLAGPSCTADMTPDTSCDKSQSETGDSETHSAIVIEQARVAVGMESVPHADFDNLQAVVRQIAEQMKNDKVSEDMALAGPDVVVDSLIDEQEDSESGPMILVGVGDKSDTQQGQGIIFNDFHAFYADNESVAADIDPQLSSISATSR